MTASIQIKGIEALQIYDSRGHPTVECTVTLANDVVGTGMVPAGASTGVPMPGFALPGAMVDIETIAVDDRDG